MVDILIIGAGVSGALIARECAKTSASVLVVDKASDVAMGTTKANSAIVHAGFDAKPGTLKAKLNVKGSEEMQELCKDLGVKYRRNGAVVVGFTPEDRETLLELKKRGEANGVKKLRVYGIREGKLVNEDGKPLAVGPDVSFLGEGVTDFLSAPTSAIVCPYELCIAAMGNAMENGASLRLNTEVTGIDSNEDGYRVTVKTKEKEEVIEAKTVINAAGVYSDVIAEMAGCGTFKITPRRGEYMLLDKTEGTRTPYTVFRCPSKMGKGILVTPTVDGNLLVGPTADDLESREDVATTAEGLTLVRTKAGEQVKNINFGNVITSFAGLRATGNTGDFVIERFDNAKNSCFVNVGAIESPGLSSAPAIAEYVAEMIKDLYPVTKEIKKECAYAGAPVEGTFYAVRKPSHWFSLLSGDEKNEVIKKNPAFGHIVCRCEWVTEGEIIEAIHTAPGATDLDGVKRRTRSGMGRCQGGFCAPLVMEILARELGVPETEITKFGNGSKINMETIKEGK